MNIFVILATLCWGCWGFCQKNAALKMGTTDVQFISFISTVLLMPVYFQTFRPEWNVRGLDNRGMAWAAFANVFSITASFAYLKAVKSADASLVSLTTSVYPVVTFILAAFFLGERVTVWKLVGIPVVVLGIWISGRD